MKLALIFIAGCISASLSYDQPPFQWQQFPPSKNPRYMALVDYRNGDPDDIITGNDNWDLNSDEENLWQPQRPASAPPLRQYHHNENVNQFYYPMSPNFLPTPVRDHERISSRQKTRLRHPFIRPSPGPADNSDTLNSNNARFFASFPNLFFPSMFYSYLSSISTSAYSTTTSYLILNSTLTTTLITSCIPLSSFSAASLAAVGCRRRRHLMDEAFVTGDDQQDLVNMQDYHHPSEEEEQQQWLGTSLMVNNGGRHVLDPEIMSSKETEFLLSGNHHLPEYLLRRARSARYTITSTFTSYSFYTVNSTKTAFLGSSLFCMPGGFRTC